MTQDRKEALVTFRVTDDYFEKINRLCDKLELSRSQTIRMMLDRGIEEFLDEKTSLRLVSNKQWNDIIQARVENFTKNVLEFKELIETVRKQVDPTGAKVQKADTVDIPEADLSEWIDAALRGDRSFETKDVDPQAQRAKEIILKIVRKCKGKID